jgi:hypothetical protein
MNEPEELGPVPPTSNDRSRWNSWVIHVADVPWGLLIAVGAVLLILLGGKEGLAKAAPLLTAAGLFGVGHGIHTAAKIRRQRSTFN